MDRNHSSRFGEATRHVPGRQDSGVFSVPAFWSLGSRQGSGEGVGFMDTLVTWPEACPLGAVNVAWAFG